MTIFGQKSMNVHRRVAFGLFALCALTTSAQAQTPPYSLFQYATLTGSGNTLTATSIPVVTSAGVTVYVNVNIQFNVDSNGVLTIATGYPQVTQAPAILASSFKAGNYIGPSNVNNGKMFITVNGPGVTAGGATEWSAGASAGADGCTYPTSATWYVGPLANNPLAARLQAAGITSTAWSYGLGGAHGCSNGDNFDTNTLLGVSQTGNSITFASFTNNIFTNNGKDSAVPVDQITYTLH